MISHFFPRISTRISSNFLLCFPSSSKFPFSSHTFRASPTPLLHSSSVVLNHYSQISEFISPLVLLLYLFSRLIYRREKKRGKGKRRTAVSRIRPLITMCFLNMPCEQISTSITEEIHPISRKPTSYLNPNRSAAL